jgi:hypothetical protein
MTARDPDLAALIDRQQVQDTVLRFATAVDTLDMALYRSIFAEEAEFDFSSFSGLPASIVAIDDWIAGIDGFLRGFDATQHLMSNFVIEVAGDAATVTVQAQAEHALANSGGDDTVSLGGHYTFRLARRAEGWKITACRLTARWHRGNRQLYALAGAGPPRR